MRIGVVGAGFMGQMHAACYGAAPGAKLAAVADIREEMAERTARTYGAAVYANAEKMFKEEDLDVADICVPTHLHCEYVKKAARAGLHVLCEKPIATTIGEANQMIRAAKKAGISFMIAQVIRFWPEYKVLKRTVAEKRLGRLLNLQMARVSPRPVWSWKNWLQNPKQSGGAFVDLHIHDADFVRYLLGEPSAIQACGTQSEAGWDHIFVNYIYKDAVVQVEGGWDYPAPFPFCMSYRAVFEGGTLEYNSGAAPTLKLYPARGKKFKAVGLARTKAGSAAAGGNISQLGGYYNEIKYFLDCLRRKESPAVTTPEDARESLALVLRELRIAGRWEGGDAVD